MTLTCAICAARFERPGRRGPVPQFCSTRCKGKRDHARPGRREYEREYRRQRRAAGLDLADNVARREYFAERWRRLYGDRHPGLEIPAPYTGHRWMDMARAAVGTVDPDFADHGYNDQVGEALLALLEGRDMHQAVADWHRREFIPRYRTVRMGEYRGEEGVDWVEEELPPEPSAEDWVTARETVLELAPRMKWKKTGRRLSARHNQPTRRRMRDAGLREHRRGGLRVA